ncbi:MAG: hypothetical protein AB1489_29350 [Acidobacteriota bacterium]
MNNSKMTNEELEAEFNRFFMRISIILGIGLVILLIVIELLLHFTMTKEVELCLILQSFLR